MNKKHWIISLAISVSAGFGATAALASNVQFGGVLPNGALVTKPVTSMEEARFENLVRQQTDYSCGAAALSTILKYAYGVDIDEATVMAGLFTVSDPKVVYESGFTLLDLKRYVESLGMRGRGYKVGMDALANIKIPGVVLLDIDGYRHFVVLRRVDGGNVYIADPALGNRHLSLDEFQKAWVNQAVFAVIGSGLDRDSPLRQIPASLTTDRWLASGAVTQVDLLDFGFTPAELF